MSDNAFTPAKEPASPTEAHFEHDTFSYYVGVYFGFIAAGVLCLIMVSNYLSAPDEFSLGLDWGTAIVFTVIGTAVGYSLYRMRQPRPAARLTIDSAAAELRFTSAEGTVLERIPFSAAQRVGIGQSQQNVGSTSTTYYDVRLHLNDDRSFQLASYASKDSAEGLRTDLNQRLNLSETGD